MSKILVLLLVFLMVPQFVFASFPDVAEEHWAYDFIEEMKNIGVIDGYEDGSFLPDGFLTKAETARILCGIAKLPEGKGSYTDVKEDDWYYTYARDCGMYMSEGNEFFGDMLMTREGLADAVVKILNLNAEDTYDAEGFSDFDSFTAPESISAAVKAGFVSGYDDGTFRPEGTITRAEVCSMLIRAFEGEQKYPEDSEKPSESKTSLWTIKKLANADLESFYLNAVLDEKGKLIFTEPEEEEELLFEINLPEGETQRETMWYLSRFIYRTDGKDENIGYTGFIPHGVFYDNHNNKTHLFGRFTIYNAPNGTKYEVNKYVLLDITFSLIKYADFEDGKVQYKDAEDCIPELVFIHNERYPLVYDGKSSVYRFDTYDSVRYGKLYMGKTNSFRGFLSIGDKMFGVDKMFNLIEYDFEKLNWGNVIKTFDADIMGTRDNKFWLWDTENGKIYTSTPDGSTDTVHENVTFESIEAYDGIDLSMLDGHMLIYDKNTFILYDGKAFLIMTKN